MAHGVLYEPAALEGFVAEDPENGERWASRPRGSQASWDLRTRHEHRGVCYTFSTTLNVGGGIVAGPASRRGFLAGALALPALFLGARMVSAASRTVRLSRPGPDGRSTTRCAACGGIDHRMLDRACPAAPEVI